MASTGTVEIRPAAGRVYGFANLILLLLLAVAIAALCTVYLLRYRQSAAPASPAPVPYLALVVQDSSVWTAGPGVQPVARPNPGVPGVWRLVRAAGDGSGLIVVSRQSGTDSLYLVRALDRPARKLAGPPRAYGVGPWRVADATWIGSTDIITLWSAGSSSERDLIATYSIDEARPHAEQWIRLQAAAGRAVSLSPDGRQIARIETLPGASGFAGQVQVRLRQVSGSRSTIALRYLGSTAPSAVLWSSDGGTLAIDVPGQGLSIQKSSGRAVHQTSSGSLPAAFSPRGAAIVYAGGSARSMRIHVLNLHGEVENVLAPPGHGSLQALVWTPDARAVVCETGGVIYQIDPATGAEQRLPGTVPGVLAGAVPVASSLLRK